MNYKKFIHLTDTHPDAKEKYCNTYTFQKENETLAKPTFTDDKTGINSNSSLLNGLNVSSLVVVDLFDEAQPFHGYSRRKYKYSVL